MWLKPVWMDEIHRSVRVLSRMYTDISNAGIKQSYGRFDEILRFSLSLSEVAHTWTHARIARSI